MTDLNALADELSFAATNTNGCLYNQRKMLNNAAKSLRAAASSQAGVLAMREAIDPWVDTRLVTFNAAIVFGHGGLDFDRWEGLRSECHTRHGSFAIWKSGRHSWSIYGGKYGLLALDLYSSERQAKEEVSQLLLSYDNEAKAVAPALTASEGNAAPGVSQQTVAEGIARIIDPEAFEDHFAYQKAANMRKRALVATATANAILSAYPLRPPGHVSIPNDILMQARCPSDARQTIGECSNCGCSIGLFVKREGTK